MVGLVRKTSISFARFFRKMLNWNHTPSIGETLLARVLLPMHALIDFT